jgi:glycosyltransferase 2 family protein
VEERDERVESAGATRRWATPLRFTVSLVLLGVIVWRLGDGVDWTHLVPDWSAESFAWLLGAAALTLGSYVLSTLRWQQVVRALELRDRFQRLLSHFLAGQFVANALPTTIGGDVVRVARLSKDTGDAPSSFASVVLERLTGWIVLPAITLLGFGLNPTLQHEGVQTEAAVAIAAVTLAGLGGLLFLVDHQRVGGRFTEGDGWRRFAAAVHLGLARLRQHPGSVFWILGAGFVYQFVLVLAAYLAALALDIEVGITALMAFFPAVLIAQVLPISIAGLGVREFMLVWLLGSVGVPKEKALALGILLWALTVVTSLAGAPSYALGARSRTVSEDVLA